MKIARGRELLTLEQRQDFMQIPEDEWILGTYFTFSKRDLEIVNKRRREENRLGFAVQLAVLRYPGWPYTHIKSIPESVIHYISKQIGATPSSISLYPQRENTLWDHLKELRSEYDFVTFTLREYRIAFKHLHQLAFENGDAIHLLHECIDFLRKNKIILPAITTLERMVWEARAMAEKKLFNTVSQSLTNEQKGKLEEIITSQHPSESNKTILGWLKEPPGHPSPETFLKVIERLEYIRGMELETVQISHLHRNRLFQLSRLGSRYEPYAFRDFQENKRYSILTVYLLHLLGFKFAPRIRDLSDSKLFTIDKASEYPKLEAILRGQINTKVIKENYEDVLRLAHSIREGTVSASLIMGKLGSYSRQNSLATALREMGRIEKTIFILNYISDESLRRKIQRGLNKGEAMNGLARAIFFGKQGELRERTIQHQLQRASALNIIINAISIWNTLHLTKAVEYQKRSGRFNEELLHHMSPLGWEHINLLGEYHFNLEKVVSLDSLRPLKLS